MKKSSVNLSDVPGLDCLDESNNSNKKKLKKVIKYKAERKKEKLIKKYDKKILDYQNKNKIHAEINEMLEEKETKKYISEKREINYIHFYILDFIFRYTLLR